MKKGFGLLLALIVAAMLNGCGGSESSAGGAAVSSKTYNWKMVTTWPPNFPVFQEGVDHFAEQVAIMSNDRLKIRVFAGGQLVPALQSFDAVSQGTVEMAHGAAYYWAGKIPAAQFFTAVPFGMNSQGMQAWLYGAGGLELYREIYAEHGLVPFPMGNTSVQMGGWFNKKINSLDDLKGLKMRMPGLGGKVLAKAGANPVLLAGGEIYTALERGTIDATEWVGPYHDQRLGLHRAAKYYYYPGWHEPGPELELTVNKQAWDSLPADLQSIVDNAARSTSLWMSAQFNAKNAEALAELRANKEIEIIAYPDEVLAELRKLAKQTFVEQAANDPLYKRVYDDYSAFQEKSQKWNAISETAYQKALEK